MASDGGDGVTEMPWILLLRSMCFGSVLEYLAGNASVNAIDIRNPTPQDVMFPATALIVLPVVSTVMEPDRCQVVTNHAISPQMRPIHGAAMAATVDMRFHRRIKPTGMDAPPTMIARVVNSHVRFKANSIQHAAESGKNQSIEHDSVMRNLYEPRGGCFWIDICLVDIEGE